MVLILHFDEKRSVLDIQLFSIKHAYQIKFILLLFKLSCNIDNNYVILPKYLIEETVMSFRTFERRQKVILTDFSTKIFYFLL